MMKMYSFVISGRTVRRIKKYQMFVALLVAVCRYLNKIVFNLL